MWEIQRRLRPISFAHVEAELLESNVDQSEITGADPNALPSGAMVWLREHNARLPDVTTLERQVTDGKLEADRRLWEKLAGQLNTITAAAPPLCGTRAELVALTDTLPNATLGTVKGLDQLEPRGKSGQTVDWRVHTYFLEYR
ncbi:hypothetical protein IEU95_08635 [Hoyosella rhizosphaerae]|uniref:Uncharacterized protein n=1 Tax=Hoyosella rhizosphaerae TaxID=1755582 RepID=A0A916XA98_9ACTN|nr:hypothetical protein [Hoyosella rhizosphaerae]MBN4926895.1 hypothetical protein [Hoyosella rhizosphaerae]GGC55677.1 hypothetical protein GCM10011410_05090 [Hoyosella rhizosphaerae]